MAIDYQTVHWDASGKPYWSDPSSGKKSYVPPMTAAESDDPQLRAWGNSQGAVLKSDGGGFESTGTPGGSFFKNRGSWNDQTGDWDQGINWGNLLALGVGGAIAAPAVAGLVGGGAAGAGAAGEAAGGVLPSTALGTGAATLPAVAASGAVPAATAGSLLPATALGTGAATLPAVAASGAVPAATGGTLAGAAAPAAAAGSGAGAAGAAAAGGSSLWSKIALPLISGGLSLAQGAISAHAANKAAEQQQAATMAALDLQKQIWQQQQANLAPYMGLGPGAIANLQGLTGTRPAGQVFSLDPSTLPGGYGFEKGTFGGK